MSKITPIHYRKLARVFELARFHKVREAGSHMIYIKAGVIRPIVIPIFIIKNLLRTAQMSREEFFILSK